MKALPTTYRGFKFASRLEARYAYFMDMLQTPWEYEKGAYDLDGLTYIPDFWLPALKVWLEVKGEIISDEVGLKVLEKAGRLAILSGHPVVLVFHDPYDARCITFGIQGGMYKDSHFGLCPHCGGFGLHVRTAAGIRFLCPEKTGHAAPVGLSALRSLHRTYFDTAMAARQKRFGVR